MRVHIYSQEIDLDPEAVQLVTTTADTGREYYGLRFFLRSPECLHYTDEDDDRSAVTFWLPGGPGRPEHTVDFLELLKRADVLVRTAIYDYATASVEAIASWRWPENPRPLPTVEELREGTGSGVGTEWLLPLILNYLREGGWGS